jgi:hypothetical protein
MTYHLNLNDPYTNRLRKNLIRYEKNYNLATQDYYDDGDYNYLPHNIRGGSLSNAEVPKEVDNVMDKLVLKYNLDEKLQGSGIVKKAHNAVKKAVKKGAKYLYDEFVDLDALKKTLRTVIWDNAYIMVCLKFGVAAAVTSLVASLGGPPGLVAATPLIIALSNEAVSQYIKTKRENDYRKEIQSKYDVDDEDDDEEENTGRGLDNWRNLGERAVIHGVNASRDYALTREIPVHSLKSLNDDWNEFSSNRLKGKGMNKRPNPNYSLDLRYTTGDRYMTLPKRRPYKEETNIDHYLKGGKRPVKRQQSDRQRRRGQLVRRIMQERNLTLSQASRYISQNKLMY